MIFFSRQQLIVILTAVLFLAGILFLRHYFPLEDQGGFFVPSREYVYEIRGGVKRPGFYTYGQEQTFEQLLNACGRQTDGIKLKQGIKTKKLKSGTRLEVFKNIRIREIDAGARMNFFLPININMASLEDLVLIPGVGKKTAESIISYRKKNKGFKDINELLSIRGIGKKKFGAITPYVSVGG